jgi:hypothetical protein
VSSSSHTKHEKSGLILFERRYNDLAWADTCPSNHLTVPSPSTLWQSKVPVLAWKVRGKHAPMAMEVTERTTQIGKGQETESTTGIRVSLISLFRGPPYSHQNATAERD